MVSQPEQRPPEKFTAAVIFLVAAPLLALVGFLVFSALRVPEQVDAAREEPSAGVEPAKVAEEQAAAAVPVEPSSKIEPVKAAARPAEAAKAEPPPSGRDVPWKAAVDDSVAPVAYEELAFLPFGEAFATKGRDDLKPWFAATPAAGFQVGKVPSRYGQSGMIDGVGRLLCPWPDLAVLRLDLENCDGLKLHFWRGETGVTLAYFEEGNRWVAQRIMREPGGVIPKTYETVATDEGRCARTEYRYGGAVEVRFVDGELLLSRGDVVLLAAALEGKPSEVFFDGRAMINGIALVRTKDAPRKYVSRSDEQQTEGKQPTLAEQLAAIDEAARLLAGKEVDEKVAADLLGRYARAGLWGADREGVPAWSSVRQAYHAAPIISSRTNLPDVSRAIRWELVSSVYRQQFEQVRDLIRRLRTFHQDRDKPLVEWAEAIAGGGGNGLALSRDAARGLLIEELSKDAYSSLTEIKAGLEGEAWDDAARLIAALRPETSAGLAPALSDEALLTTVPVAVENILEERGEVRDAMAGQFAATAKLRIAQAIQAGNWNAIELATVQFAGMPAAADAEQWLGDRALVEGRFAEAVKRFARALKLVPELADELGPRLRLAGAMAGEAGGVQVADAVSFGERKLSANEFEQLVQEMRTRGARQKSLSGESEGTKGIPEAGKYVAKVRGRLEGAVGERPQEEGAKRTNQLRVPWVDRQLATTVDENVMVVSNRFQVAAFDGEAGKWLWQSETPGQTMQRAQDWPLIPMRPLVGSDRIITRLLYSANPLLVCLDKQSGKLLWTVETREREAMVSDPLLMNGQVVVLSAVNEGDQTLRLLWRAFDLQTGDAIARKDLVRLRGSWGARRCTQVAPLEDGMVAVLGGVTLATNGEGDVRWVRKQLTLPAEDDPRWILQEYGAPVVDGGRVFIAQPGVRSVECVVVRSGERIWQAVLPEVVGIVGKSGEVLLVRTEDDVRGLNLADGTTQWRYAVPELLGFPLVDEKQVLVASRERAAGSDEEQVRVTWLDSSEGKVVGSSVVEGVAEKELRLGPATLVGGRVMALIGRGQNDPTRDVVEWTVEGKVEAATKADTR
jgi:outer membrane protein assembly factor BamB